MSRKRPPRAYLDALAEHQRRLDRLSLHQGPKQLKAVYDDAQAHLVRKMHAAAKAGRAETFSMHQYRVLSAQVRAGQAQMAARMAGKLHDVSKQAQKEAVRGLTHDLNKLEKHFTGADIVLPLDEATRFQGIVKGQATSLLRTNQTSMARYGARVVKSMEDRMTLGLMTGDTTSEVIDAVAGVGDLEWWQGERIVRTECLPGNTLVSGAVVGAAHKRWYEGPLVEVVTKNGRKFSATPNHPMLTRRGWVGAGSLHHGDHLVGYTGQQHPCAAGDKHVARGPTTISQVFDATAAVGVQERRGGSEPDFHGDGREGEVYVARPNRELGYGVFAPISQELAQYVFSPTHLARARFCIGCRQLLGVAKRCSCGYSANRLIHLFQTLTDGGVAHAQRFRDMLGSLARAVALSDFGYGQVAHAGVFTAASVESVARLAQTPSYISFAHHPADPLFPNVHGFGNLRDAEPRDIEFDGVASVSIRAFCGHVFNLTTPNGYFTINGFYTGNTAWAFNGAHHAAIQEAAVELPDLQMRWSEHVDDATGQPFDDRVGADSLALHGQVAPPGGFFTMPVDPDVSPTLWGRSWMFPPNRANDRAALAPWRPTWGIPGWRLVGGAKVPV